MIKGRPTGRPSRLGVGIADAVPKLAAFRILEPVLRMDPLIVEFGALGAGLFAAPDEIMEDALRARGLQRVGSIEALRERYYAISIDRKLAHPAVVAIAGAARRRWYVAE